MKSFLLTVCVVAAIAFLRMSEAHADEPGQTPLPSADRMHGKAPGDVRDDNGLKVQLVWCPPGAFAMERVEQIAEAVASKEDGKPDNGNDAVDPKVGPEPRRKIKITPVKVLLTKGYWLTKCEVTQSEWKQVMKTEPWKGQDSTKEGVDFPATHVSWNDATDFCRKLTEQERQAGRLSNDWEYTLPTDAQWERACRAQTETKFSFGDDASKLGDYAWWGGLEGDGNAKTEPFAHRVGQKKANPWGLCDMHGNVWEWCRDTYTLNLSGGRDPEVKSDEEKGSNRVIRGGSWSRDAAGCRSGARYGYPPDNRLNYLGFRPALSAVEPVK
jgi:sulfatase modifying factor 1